MYVGIFSFRWRSVYWLTNLSSCVLLQSPTVGRAYALLRCAFTKYGQVLNICWVVHVYVSQVVETSARFIVFVFETANLTYTVRKGNRPGPLELLTHSGLDTTGVMHSLCPALFFTCFFQKFPAL